MLINSFLIFYVVYLSINVCTQINIVIIEICTTLVDTHCPAHRAVEEYADIM